MTPVKISTPNFILSCFYLLLGTILMGLVLSLFWGWFVVPVLGLPGINGMAGAGLVLICRYMLKGHEWIDGDGVEITASDLWRSFVITYLSPAIVFTLLGFFVRAFLVLTYKG